VLDFPHPQHREHPIPRIRVKALALVGVCIMPGCGKFGQDFAALQNLAFALQAKYHRSVNVALTKDDEITVRLIQQAPIDTMKFTRDDCHAFANDVAQFTLTHYPQPKAINDVWVYVSEVNDYGPVHMSQEYCSGSAR
jgi:hypothetical protein